MNRSAGLQYLKKGIPVGGVWHQIEKDALGMVSGIGL